MMEKVDMICHIAISSSNIKNMEWYLVLNRKDAVHYLCFQHGLYMYYDISNTQPLRVLTPVDILKEVNKKLLK